MLAGVLGAATLLLPACGTDAPTAGDTAGLTQSAATLRPASLWPGQPVPVPSKPVLTLTGRVTADNRGRAVQFDRAGLERLRVVKVRAYEPWVKQQLDFRGVWLADVLEIAGAEPGWTSLRIVALDDYQVDVDAADVRGGGILLATADGEGRDVPVAKGGPTRLVYVGRIAAAVNADQWIWSLKTIDVR